MIYLLFIAVFALGVFLGVEWQHWYSTKREIDQVRSVLQMLAARHQQFADAIEARAVEHVRQRRSRGKHTWD